MERKPLPDWCTVGASSALLVNFTPPLATLVTISKVNKFSVTVTDRQGWETVVSVERGLMLGLFTELLPVGDPRVDVVFAAQRRARITSVVQDALADWAKTGDDASLRVAVEALREAG